jgi:hypothetical protein
MCVDERCDDRKKKLLNFGATIMAEDLSFASVNLRHGRSRGFTLNATDERDGA